MKKILRPAWAEIDLDAIAYNTRNIKQFMYETSKKNR
mgnify:CR=1 FL=1